MEHELHLNSSIRTILDTLGVFLEMLAASRRCLCVPPYFPTIPTPSDALCKHQHSQVAATVPLSRYHCCAALRAAASAPPSIDAGASPVGHVRKSPCELIWRTRAPSDVAAHAIFRQTNRMCKDAWSRPLRHARQRFDGNAKGNLPGIARDDGSLRASLVSPLAISSTLLPIYPSMRFHARTSQRYGVQFVATVIFLFLAIAISRVLKTGHQIQASRRGGLPASLHPCATDPTPCIRAECSRFHFDESAAIEPAPSHAAARARPHPCSPLSCPVASSPG